MKQQHTQVLPYYLLLAKAKTFAFIFHHLLFAPLLTTQGPNLVTPIICHYWISYHSLYRQNLQCISALSTGHILSRSLKFSQELTNALEIKKPFKASTPLEDLKAQGLTIPWKSACNIPIFL